MSTSALIWVSARGRMAGSASGATWATLERPATPTTPLPMTAAQATPCRMGRRQRWINSDARGGRAQDLPNAPILRIIPACLAMPPSAWQPRAPCVIESGRTRAQPCPRQCTPDALKGCPCCGPDDQEHPDQSRPRRGESRPSRERHCDGCSCARANPGPGWSRWPAWWSWQSNQLHSRCPLRATQGGLAEPA